MWQIPDKGVAADNIQSILFSEYLDILVDGLSGMNYVAFGCAVTSNSNMTVAVAGGCVLTNRAQKLVTAGNGTITAANATNPRIDIVVIDSTGAIAVRAGTAAVAPKPALAQTNDVAIAAVFVPANDTVIAANQITDLRVMQESGIPRIVRKGANEAFSTTAFNNSTDLDLHMEASGIYAFEYHVYFNTNATTVGIRLSVNCTNAPTSIVLGATIPTSAPGNASTFANGAQTAKDTTIFATTSGPGPSPAHAYAMVSGVIQCSATGTDTLKLRHGSETATATTILANSWGRITRIG